MRQRSDFKLFEVAFGSEYNDAEYGGFAEDVVVGTGVRVFCAVTAEAKLRTETRAKIAGRIAVGSDRIIWAQNGVAYCRTGGNSNGERYAR